MEDLITSMSLKVSTFGMLVNARLRYAQSSNPLTLAVSCCKYPLDWPFLTE